MFWERRRRRKCTWNRCVEAAAGSYCKNNTNNNNIMCFSCRYIGRTAKKKKEKKNSKFALHYHVRCAVYAMWYQNVREYPVVWLIFFSPSSGGDDQSKTTTTPLNRWHTHTHHSECTQRIMRLKNSKIKSPRIAELIRFWMHGSQSTADRTKRKKKIIREIELTWK